MKFIKTNNGEQVTIVMSRIQADCIERWLKEQKTGFEPIKNPRHCMRNLLNGLEIINKIPKEGEFEL